LDPPLPQPPVKANLKKSKVQKTKTENSIKKKEEEANRSDPPLPRPSKNKQGAKKQN
jgi:hypothetical protein